MRRVLSLVAAIVLSVVIVTGGTMCSPNPTATPKVVVATPTSGPTPTAAAEPQTLLIGNLQILSGAGSGYGIPASRGVERGIELWNDGGGVVAGGKRYMLKIDTYDWGYSADAGRTGAEKAINDGCRIIFGTGTSNTVGAQQVTEPNKVLLLAVSGSDDVVAAKFPYTFRIFPGAVDQFAPGLSYLRKTYPDKSKVFMTTWNDASGKLTWEAWQPTFNKAWSKVDFQYYEPGTTDFAPFITSYLLPANADVFAFIGRTGETGNLIKAARQYGFKGLIAWFSAAGSVPELKIAGDLGDGTILNGEWDWNGQYVPELAKPEALKYISKYGTNPPQHFIAPFEAFRMLAAALKKTGTPDATALRDALPTVTWDSYWGGTGKLYPVKDRQGAAMAWGIPISKYDSKTQTLVNIGFGLPPSLGGQ